MLVTCHFGSSGTITPTIIYNQKHTLRHIRSTMPTWSKHQHHHHHHGHHEDRQASFIRSGKLPEPIRPIARLAPNHRLSAKVSETDPEGGDITDLYARSISVLHMDVRDDRMISPIAGMTLSEISTNAAAQLNMLTEGRHKSSPTDGYSLAVYYSHLDQKYAWTMFLGIEANHSVPPAPYSNTLRDLMGQHSAFASMFWPTMSDTAPPVLQISIMWKDRLMGQFVFYGYNGPQDMMIRRMEWFEEVAAALAVSPDRRGLVVMIAAYFKYEVHCISVPFEGRVLAITTDHVVVALDKPGVVFELRASPRGSAQTGVVDIESIDLAFWAQDRNMGVRLSLVPREYFVVAHLADIGEPLRASRAAKGRVVQPDQRLDSTQVFTSVSHIYHLMLGSHPRIAPVAELEFVSIEDPDPNARHIALIRQSENLQKAAITHFSTDRQIPTGPVEITPPNDQGVRRVIPARATIQNVPTRPEADPPIVGAIIPQPRVNTPNMCEGVDLNVPKPPPAQLARAGRTTSGSRGGIIPGHTVTRVPEVDLLGLDHLNLEPGVGDQAGRVLVNNPLDKALGINAGPAKPKPPPPPLQVTPMVKQPPKKPPVATKVQLPAPVPRAVDLTLHDSGRSQPIMGTSTNDLHRSNETFLQTGGGIHAADPPPQKVLMDSQDLTISPYRARAEILAKQFLRALRLTTTWIDGTGGTGLIDSVINNIAANLRDGPATVDDALIWNVIAVEFMEMKRLNGRSWDGIDVSKIPPLIPEDSAVPQFIAPGTNTGPSLKEIAESGGPRPPGPPGLQDCSASIASDLSTHESEILVESEEPGDFEDCQPTEPEPDRGCGVIDLTRDD